MEIAKTDLYCSNCGEQIYNKGDELMNLGGFTGTEECCKKCGTILKRRSPGGQSDWWNFVTYIIRGCPSCKSTTTMHNSWCKIHLTPLRTDENKSKRN